MMGYIIIAKVQLHHLPSVFQKQVNGSVMLSITFILTPL